ncbi:MAG TPA: PAS domain-containing protein [Thermoleophilia bacterium]|nr:PAS domain-containing protein [Thermoleophilia bacterium]
MTLDLRHETLAGAPHAGELSADELELVVWHLPIQTSFADAEGTLLWWHGEIFADCEDRWIGRHVNECHAPSSRPTIDRMIEEFRAGTKDAATFWMLEDDRLVLYRYIAVRDGDGVYRGILETLEDITDVQRLEGEKKALDW